MKLQWDALLPGVLTPVQQRIAFAITIESISYPKWAFEAFVIVNVKRSSVIPFL